MNDQDEVGRRIARLLDESTDTLSQEQRDRLSAARRLALARHQPKPERVAAWVPAWAGPLAGFTEKKVFGIQYLIPIAALVLGLAGVAYVHSGTSSDIADLDASLLTDELPINAYLDQDFASWLKRSSR